MEDDGGGGLGVADRRAEVGGRGTICLDSLLDANARRGLDADGGVRLTSGSSGLCGFRVELEEVDLESHAFRVATARRVVEGLEVITGAILEAGM